MANAFVPDPTLSVTDGGLTKLGSGTLILSGTNTYLGGTKVENGELIVSSPAAIDANNVGTNLYVGTSLSLFSGAIAADAGHPAAAVPEPATVALVAAGVALLALRRLRYDRRNRALIQ
jgi:autotransporter-associated beta strand protein